MVFSWNAVKKLTPRGVRRCPHGIFKVETLSKTAEYPNIKTGQPLSDIDKKHMHYAVKDKDEIILLGQFYFDTQPGNF
jgi:hypothetical protein